MESRVLHTVWCKISGEAAGEIRNWSLLGVKGLRGWGIIDIKNFTDSVSGPWLAVPLPQGVPPQQDLLCGLTRVQRSLQTGLHVSIGTPDPSLAYRRNLPWSRVLLYRRRDLSVSALLSPFFQARLDWSWNMIRIPPNKRPGTIFCGPSMKTWFELEVSLSRSLAMNGKSSQLDSKALSVAVLQSMSASWERRN